MTPAELFFDSIGQGVQQASSAVGSYAAQIAQLEKRIINSRKAFFSCLPSCKDLYKKRVQYSKALMDKDIYFLENSGQSKSLVHQGQRNMATIIEGLSGTSGVTLIDDGIPKVCGVIFQLGQLK